MPTMKGFVLWKSARSREAIILGTQNGGRLYCGSCVVFFGVAQGAESINNDVTHALRPAFQDVGMSSRWASQQGAGYGRTGAGQPR